MDVAQQPEDVRLQNAIVKQLAANFYTHMKTPFDYTWLRDPLRVAINYINNTQNVQEKSRAAIELVWDGESDITLDDAVAEVAHLLTADQKVGGPLHRLSQVVKARLEQCYGVNSVQHLFLKDSNDQFAIDLTFRGKRAVPLPQVLIDNLFFKAKDPEGFFARQLTDKFNQSVVAMTKLKTAPAEWDVDFLLNFVFGIVLFIGAGLAFVSACLPKGETDEQKEHWENTKKPIDITACLFLFLASIVIFVIAGFRANEHKKEKEEHGKHISRFQALKYEFFPRQEEPDGDESLISPMGSDIFVPIKNNSFILDPPAPKDKVVRRQSSGLGPIPLPSKPKVNIIPEREPQLVIHSDPDPVPIIRIPQPLVDSPIRTQPVVDSPIRTQPVVDSPVIQARKEDAPIQNPLQKLDQSQSYHRRGLNNPFRKMSADYAYGHTKVHYV